MAKESLWEAGKRQDPNRSAAYIRRFEELIAQGVDLHGEARCIDALAARSSRILDAGCGQGRVGGELARRGHTVIGVDADAELVEAARTAHPESAWLVGDLTELDLPARGIAEPFDVIVCAGNVLAFLAPGTSQEVLTRLHRHLAKGGRLIVGFGAGHDYTFEKFFADAAGAGFTVPVRLATWDLRAWTPSSDFLVAVCEAEGSD
ncbi:class I SAM-dependent methyltransferase [Pseudarthrobacter sp. NS4]|uniref:class I SAM-dependent methyltransferase n=1 Tax=Pseudarthrobacter sp. NS4 TaxID=2973976 RepID=UPI002161CF86|nr:class I SAM-dependent methyltransferase [Pseudarthrobacter sp. NS4]